MKVILIDVITENYGDLGYVVAEAIYNHYCHHNFRAYEIVLDDPVADEAKINMVEEYNPEYLAVVLKPGRTVEELPVDMQSNIWQEIKITGKGE